MKVKDIETGHFSVLQKGNRFHVAHLNPECIAAIRAYLRSFTLWFGVRREDNANRTRWRPRDGGARLAPQ